MTLFFETSSMGKESMLSKSVKWLQPEIILDIEGDSHVCGLPLYVELVARLQAKQERIMECKYVLLMYLPKAQCLI